MLKKFILSICFSCFLVNLAYSQPNKNVSEYTLDNGLRVIVQQNDRAPVVVSMIWYRVGSGDEPGGITGVSHALEHMMYKGTEKNPGGQFSLQIATQGGQENAFTSYDFTAYYQKLSNEDLALSFELEADRMRNLVLDEKEFNQEIRVIQEERRMRTDDNPEGLTYERFMASAHLAAPYHHPIIGWMNDLKNMQVSDLREWYQRWYAPNNAIIVVTGDVDPEQVYELAKKYFADIPARALPEVKPQREPPALGKRTVNVQTIATLPTLYLGYNTPSLVTAKEPWHAYALEVIAALLAGSESSRLPTDLIRELEIAADVDASYGLYSRFDALLTLTGIPATGYDVDALKNALLAQIERLQKEAVQQSELERIKTQVIADQIFAQDSLFGQAMQIGALETIGLDWSVGDDYVEQIQNITPEQVRSAAQLFLIPERLTAAVLVPSSPNQSEEQ